MAHTKKLQKKHWGFLIGLAVVMIAFSGVAYYHHHEYQKLYFNFDGGGGATISRHNFNKLSAAEKQTLLHPVDESILHPCTVNTGDQCKGAPTIDFWPAGNESATNIEYSSLASDVAKEIMGRITTISGNSLKIKTSSGRTFTINYPTGIVLRIGPATTPKDSLVPAINDMLYISYTGSPSPNSLTIQTSQIHFSSILLTDTKTKADPEVKY